MYLHQSFCSFFKNWDDILKIIHNPIVGHIEDGGAGGLLELAEATVYEIDKNFMIR